MCQTEFISNENRLCLCYNILSKSSFYCGFLYDLGPACIMFENTTFEITREYWLVLCVDIFCLLYLITTLHQLQSRECC